MKYTDLITDKLNYDEDVTCNGIKFPTNLYGPMGLNKSLTINEILLPYFGEIIMETASEFIFVNDAKQKCKKQNKL